MVKKKSNEKENKTISAFKKRSERDLIQDTSAGPMICDTDNSNADIILETRLNNYRKTNTVVFSMRMNEDLLNRVKQRAREKSAELKADVPYQLLIIQAVEERYPVKNNRKEK